MKKIVLVLALIGLFVFASCGDKTAKETSTATDSTTVATDSVKVDSLTVTVDSTATK